MRPWLSRRDGLRDRSKRITSCVIFGRQLAESTRRTARIDRMQRPFLRRLALLAIVPFAVACAADLPADERMAMMEDSALAEDLTSAQATQLERARIAGCLEAYNAQFDVAAVLDSTGKGDSIPAELAAAVVERDYEIGEDPNFARSQ